MMLSFNFKMAGQKCSLIFSLIRISLYESAYERSEGV